MMTLCLKHFVRRVGIVDELRNGSSLRGLDPFHRNRGPYERLARKSRALLSVGCFVAGIQIDPVTCFAETEEATDQDGSAHGYDLANNSNNNTIRSFSRSTSGALEVHLIDLDAEIVREAAFANAYENSSDRISRAFTGPDTPA